MNRRYPDDLPDTKNGYNGEFWFTYHTKLLDRWGSRPRTDTALLMVMACTGPRLTQDDTAHAVYQTAKDLGYEEEELQVLYDLNVNECGYPLSFWDRVKNASLLGSSAFLIGSVCEAVVFQDRRRPVACWPCPRMGRTDRVSCLCPGSS